MSILRSPTRRTILAASLATAALAAGRAHAATRLSYPLRLLYGRIGPDGLEPIEADEQELWSRMGVRLAGLVSRIEPLQQYSMLTNNPPSLQSENGNVLVARDVAKGLGLDHVLLYASRDGRREYTGYENWVSRAFNGLRSRVTPGDDAVAEAHIIATSGGPPLISLAIDTPGRNPLNPLHLGRKPEHEAMLRLTSAVESRIQDDARATFAGQASIGD